MIRIFATAALVLTGAACAPVEDEAPFVSEAPPARVVGEPVDCLSTTRIRNSRVHDDRTIDFLTGSETYRNTLSRGCSSLGFEKSFTYRTTTNRLCEGEIIYVLRTIGGRPERGTGCALGEFVPIGYVERDIDTIDR